MKIQLFFVAAALALSAAPNALAQELRVGRTVSGALSASDSTDDRNRHVDTYTLRGEAGQALRIDMRSRFDNYLYIHGPNGFYMADDDSGGNYNAALLLSLPETGEYRIQATSLSASTRGSYRLSASRVDPRTMAATAPAAGALSVGQEISGTLAENSPRMDMHTNGVAYTFHGAANQEVEFRLHSTAYGPRLRIIGPGGFASENGYDILRGRPSQYARVTVTLPADGEYRVIAASRDRNRTGAYTLNVVDGATAARDRAALIAAAPQHAQTAYNHLENGDNDNAIAYYEYALRLSPNNTAWRNNLGVAEMRRGNNDTAVIHFDQSLRLDPDNAFARRTRERALQRQRNAQAQAQQERPRQQAAN
ncbi:MAG TPA: tetratricopeptide repeat protein, partial [Terricaulis sp.]|nr:tetratricopeptide repeat protein [Terricaulis sp.]